MEGRRDPPVKKSDAFLSALAMVGSGKDFLKFPLINSNPSRYRNVVVSGSPERV
jgi:hypothetical protein